MKLMGHTHAIYKTYSKVKPVAHSLTATFNKVDLETVIAPVCNIEVFMGST